MGSTIGFLSDPVWEISGHTEFRKVLKHVFLFFLFPWVEIRPLNSQKSSGQQQCGAMTMFRASIMLSGFIQKPDRCRVFDG